MALIYIFNGGKNCSELFWICHFLKTMQSVHTTFSGLKYPLFWSEKEKLHFHGGVF